MGFSLKNIGSRIWDQVNMWDDGRTWKQRTPVQRPQPNNQPVRAPLRAPVDTRSQRSRYWDQINPFDGGRTAKQATPTTTSSVIGQTGRILNAAGQGWWRGVGGVQSDVSGFIDLVTPGTGTSRYTKAANKLNEDTDRRVREQDLSRQIYTAGQVGANAAAFAAPGAFAGKAGLIDEGASLVNKGGPVVRWATKPATILDVGMDTAQGAGFRAARGQDVSPQNVATDLAVSTAFGGALAGGGAVLNKSLNAVDNSIKPVYADNSLDAKLAAHNAKMNDPNWHKKNIEVNQKIVENAQNKFAEEERLQKIMGSGSKKSKAYTKAKRELTYAQKDLTAAQEFAKKFQTQPIPMQEATDAAKRIVDAKPKVSLKQKADKLAADIDAKAAAKGRRTTFAEEKKIAKAYKEAGVDPATVPAGKNMYQPKPKKNPYATDVTMKDPNRWQRFWQSTNGIISQYGDVGKEVAQKIKNTREFAEVRKADIFNNIPDVQRLSKDEMVEFADVLDTLSKGKKPKNVSPTVAAAVTEWQRVIPTVLADARAAGIEMGDLGPNYFPRFYKDIDSPKFVDRLMKEAADKGKPITRAEAVKRAKFIREADVKKYGHLEKSRTGDYGGYEKSHEAIANYVEGAYDRIARAKEFGANDELLDQAKAALLEQGYDVNDLPNKKSLFSRYVDIARGDTDRSTTGWKASNAMRQVNAVTSLSAAGISNAGQLTNTAAVGGIGRTFKNMLKVSNDNFKKKFLSEEARNIATKSGVALDHQIKSVTEATQGTTNKITRNIASPFFAAIEKFNREVTALTGADYGNHLAKKVANGDVKAEAILRDKLGVTGKIGSELTEAQQIQAARKMVEVAQFKVDPMDMPGWVESPMGKLAMQFRSFGYKQTGFMYNQVLQEARKGNFAPLARFIAVGTPVGLAGAAAKDAVKFRDSEENKSLPEKVVKGVSETGGFGMPGSIAQSLKRGADYGTPITSAITTAGGPTAGLIVEGIDKLNKAQQGNPEPLIKMGVRKIPMVGPTVAGYLSQEGKPFETTKPAEPPKEGEKPSAKYIKDQTKKEIDELENRKELDFNVKKLSDGRFAFTIPGDVDIHYAKDQNDYKKKSSQAMFEISGEEEKTVGDWHFTRESDGTVKAEKKYWYEFNKEDSQNQLDMYIYKEDENYGAWNEVAGRQLKALEKLKAQQEKDNQDDNVDDTQKKIETLKNQMKKYADYGGSFTKPKKARSGGGGSGGSSGGYGNYESPSKYRVSISSPTPKFGGAPKVAPKVAGSAKKGNTSKPRVSIKKSKV